jgi:two-component system cell cycle sensor histidine kinase/response regulator CckA
MNTQGQTPGGTDDSLAIIVREYGITDIDTALDPSSLVRSLAAALRKERDESAAVRPGLAQTRTEPSIAGHDTECIDRDRDIAARKAVERRLAREVELLNVTLSSIREGVISTDETGKILLINNKAAELTGWDPRSAVGESLQTVFRIKEPGTLGGEGNLMTIIAATGKLAETEFAIVNTRSGRECSVACSGTPLRDGSGSVIGVVMVFRDIGTTKQLEDELFRARKLESVGVLAGGIAHDFNNILTGIVSNLFMAKSQLTPGSEPYDLITEAEKAGFRASKLTKQLLTFAKGGTPVMENVSLRELIGDSVGFCLSGSNVDCTIEVDEKLFMAEIDRGQIDQVLNNLIINASQAMPEGGTIVVKAENVTVSDKVSQNTEARLPLNPGNYIKISIRDEGVGIPRENLARIFDPYFTTKPNGTGLGLTTVYSIIKKHGGFITVKSPGPKGAIFIFYLPASSAGSESPKPEDAGVSAVNRGRILVMDDEQVIRVIVEKMLKRFGYDAICVPNGSEAIATYRHALLEGRRFDVVIMDLTIPGGMGGREAVKRLLEIDPAARVVVASGYSNDPVMAEFRQYGFAGVIAKPFNIDEYVRVIGQVMAG